MLDIKYYIKSGTNKVYCRVSKGRISNGGFMVRKAVNNAVLYDAKTKFRIERIINANGQQVSSGDLLYIITPL